VRRLGNCSRAWMVSLALCSGLTASAYILPGSSILRRMVGARGDLQLVGLRIDGGLTLHGSSAAEAATALGMTLTGTDLALDGTVLWLKVPGRCRLEVTTPAGKVSVTQSFGKKKVEGPEVTALNVGLQQLCPLLAARAGSDLEAKAALERHLKTLDIEPRQSSLARFGGQVVYVLGHAEPGSPQLWIYKDNFLPARLRFKDELGNEWMLAFLDYSSPATGEWFPRVLEVWKGSELALKFTGYKADARSPVSDKLF
jgi:hypothetical protein